MSEISFVNYFGGQNDFENLKKWFKVNSDLYKEVLQVAKERYELELEYSSKLSKLSSRLGKAFQMPIGSVSNLWNNTAHYINDESEIHKRLGSQLQDEFYKPLVIASDQFVKFKKPVEIDIDKCLKLYQDRREEELRLKKKATTAMKDCEKAFENIEEYKRSHPSSISGNDKERTKIEKRAQQLRDISTKAEAEYFESSLAVEESRHSWEQSYLSGLEQLQKFETDRLKSMKTVIESYQKYIGEIPSALNDLSSKMKLDIQKTNINDDLVENAMHYTNKSPNIYKTEQILLTLYSESKENTMDLQRRIENIQKRISTLYQNQMKNDNLRTGSLKMLMVYEKESQYADEATKKKTKREYSKIQSLVNLLSANIYKLLLALNTFQQKPAPTDPLTSLGMRINNNVDRNSMLTAILESRPGSVLSPCDPGVLNRSNSSNNEYITQTSNTVDDFDDFDADSDEESPIPKASASLQSKASFQSTKEKHNSGSFKRPLPALPKKDMSNLERYKALHSFSGRDEEELSFNQGDVIIVRKKIDDVWWEGELNGRTGLIPKAYVDKM